MEASRRRFLSSLIVPLLVLVAVPMAVLWLSSSQNRDWAGQPPLSVIVTTLGLALIALGLILFVATIRIFARHGQGTIMPWDPTQVLIVQGAYRYVRNPMHTGVFLVLLGEGLVLRSMPLLLLTAAVVVLHLFYIPLSEERGLEARFGEAYRDYKRNVPRWIPRLTPWEPPNSAEQECANEA
jgi:protein-S-isoprenylcysteine O-methyltransferase Ste14